MLFLQKKEGSEFMNKKSVKNRNILIGGIVLLLVLFLLFGNSNFAITGDTSVIVNTPYTAQISTTSSVQPDNVFTDGTATKLFATTALYDKDGLLIKSLPQVELSSATYTNTFTHTFTQTGDYYLVSIIGATSTTYNFSTQKWADWSAPVQTGSDSIKIVVRNIDGPVDPPEINLLTALFDFIKTVLALFGIVI